MYVLIPEVFKLYAAAPKGVESIGQESRGPENVH